MSKTRPAVFLDRDGTLSEEVGYMRHLSMYKVFAWTAPAIRRINDSGVAAVVITNQSGLARGYFEVELVEQVHERLRQELEPAGAHIDGIYYCPHHPNDGCRCRKPLPGLLERASAEMDLDLGRSFMIGDRYTDVQAGVAAAARTILVLTGVGEAERARHRNSPIQPDHVVPTLEDAVDIVLRDRS